MINDLDATLEKIIYTVGKMSRNDVDIAFDQPNRDWASRLGRPTINMWSFDLRENVKLRNVTRSVTNNDRQAHVRIPPKRMDISYWVTAWARKIEDEHRLLWRALGALKRTPTIDPRTAEGDLRYCEYVIPMYVADLTQYPINMSDLWGVMDNSMRLGFLVVATLELNLESDFDTPLVLEKTLRFGQSEDPTEARFSVADDEIVQKGNEKVRQPKNSK